MSEDQDDKVPASEKDLIQRQLIRCLDDAERSRSGDFIGFKWFRDGFLAGRKLAWAANVSARQSALTLAIQDRLILVDKRLNPNEPQFGTTAIRLNRTDSRVLEYLGQQLGRSPLRPPVSDQ